MRCSRSRQPRGFSLLSRVLSFSSALFHRPCAGPFLFHLYAARTSRARCTRRRTDVARSRSFVRHRSSASRQLAAERKHIAIFVTNSLFLRCRCCTRRDFCDRWAPLAALTAPRSLSSAFHDAQASRDMRVSQWGDVIALSPSLALGPGAFPPGFRVSFPLALVPVGERFFVTPL